MGARPSVDSRRLGGRQTQCGHLERRQAYVRTIVRLVKVIGICYVGNVCRRIVLKFGLENRFEICILG